MDTQPRFMKSLIKCYSKTHTIIILFTPPKFVYTDNSAL